MQIVNGLFGRVELELWHVGDSVRISVYNGSGNSLYFVTNSYQLDEWIDAFTSGVPVRAHRGVLEVSKTALVVNLSAYDGLVQPISRVEVTLEVNKAEVVVSILRSYQEKIAARRQTDPYCGLLQINTATAREIFEAYQRLLTVRGGGIKAFCLPSHSEQYRIVRTLVSMNQVSLLQLLFEQPSRLGVEAMVELVTMGGHGGSVRRSDNLSLLPLIEVIKSRIDEFADPEFAHELMKRINIYH